MKIHIFQHVPYEGPAKIEAWLKEQGHELKFSRLYESSRIPLLKSIQGLVIMGGPMGVNDEEKYPWLKLEKAFIKKALEAGLPVLGVCLGAQLMAAALGAKVYANKEKEIGWWELKLTPEGVESGLLGEAKAPQAFHWHGDTFDLPLGATRLAKSADCLNQAFSWGQKALGLQFHLEVGPAELRAMCKAGKGELEAGGKRVQDAKKILQDSKNCSSLAKPLEAALSKLFT
jgi:GMP synthase-like glutamine amidotransferase